MSNLDNNTIVFGAEYEEKQDFGLVSEGNYEVEIDKVEKKISKNGNKYLTIRFTIREDVDQSFKKRKLFYTIMGTTSNRLGYDFNKINRLILTQKNQKTYKCQFTEADEVLQYLHGLKMSLYVETTFDSIRGSDINVIQDDSFGEPTTVVTTNADTTSAADDLDENLPF